MQGLAHASERAILAESRLSAGRAYTEDELGAAIHRITRLPFVRDADFRLEKGTVRDTYVLSIKIEETSPFFYGLEHSQAWFDTGNDVAPASADRAVAGVRWFFGKNSVHLLGDIGGEDRAQIGFTSYGIFGTSASLSVNVVYQQPNITVIGPIAVDSDVTRRDNFRYNAVAVVPIRGSHSLRASLDQHTGISSRFTPGPPRSALRLLRYSRRVGEASWVFDTTDDALFPTTGTLATAGLRFTQTEDFAGRIDPDRVHLTVWRDRAAQFTHHWSMSRRSTLHLNAQYYTVVDRHTAAYELGTAYSANLVPSGRMRGDDLRLEVGARTNYTPSQDIAISTIESSIGYRNKWGVMRFGLSYVTVRGAN